MPGAGHPWDRQAMQSVVCPVEGRRWREVPMMQARKEAGILPQELGTQNQQVLNPCLVPAGSSRGHSGACCRGGWCPEVGGERGPPGPGPGSQMLPHLLPHSRSGQSLLSLGMSCHLRWGTRVIVQGVWPSAWLLHHLCCCERADGPPHGAPRPLSSCPRLAHQERSWSPCHLQWAKAEEPAGEARRPCSLSPISPFSAHPLPHLPSHHQL